MSNHPLFPVGFDSTRRGAQPVCPGQVAVLALGMRPGHGEESGPRAAFGARDGGGRSRMGILGRLIIYVIKYTNLPEGVLATTDYIVAANRCLRADGVCSLAWQAAPDSGLPVAGLGVASPLIPEGIPLSAQPRCERGRRGRVQREADLILFAGPLRGPSSRRWPCACFPGSRP